MRTNIAALLSLPLLAAHARHGQGGQGLTHGHGVHHRALEVQVVTITEVIYHTVTVVASSAPESSASALPQKEAPQAPPVAPPTSPPINSGNPYQPLVPIANSASVKNSCDYPVYLKSEGHESCDPGVECELIAPNSTYTEKMRSCKDGGISLKISKTKAMHKPMQFEYSVWPDKELVSYDISYLNCMKNQKGEKDLSGCAGHEGGIQAGAGDDSCPDYHCKANEWCDQQAYVVAEFDYKPGAPVGACAVEKGIAFELCAGNQ
ncbi:uncharacterized protein K460DRAFT_280513 [Cucurbitaria berberidis CBS 394.84]|uniref:Uncharacterized protein n=1 Tax=Cucurbitaria berberidis CBS 394.84 TaxID=1168544 RepID=A0A9P4GK19_9PLEO|nr:uncharacterized protein K460DRAFT_280513 [Cucurbitaria berberidis CBS 394.84]KAF1847052.1 hypothetical protein K460DRAFT_280513 [Cucurbitaria berberidis CBS 394.84]